MVLDPDSDGRYAWGMCLAVVALVSAVSLAQEEARLPAPASPLLYAPTYDECLRDGKPVITRKDLYHDGWIDLNKNGRKDIYEDPTEPEDKRLDDLIS